MTGDRGRTRLNVAQALVALQADCDDLTALRLMIELGHVDRQSLTEVVEGVLDGTIQFGPQKIG